MTGRKLTMVFRKNQRTNTWYLYAFRKNQLDTLRILDEDKRDLLKHQAVWAIPGLEETVTAAATQKTIDVNLVESVYKTYVDGTFTTEFDETESESRGSQSASQENIHATMRDYMRIAQETNNDLIRNLVSSMKEVMGRKDTQRMIITKFSGSNEDPRTWLTLFERACEVNHWLNDELKINNLKSCLEPNSAADRWYSSRIIDPDQEQEEWELWKDAFLSAFCQNRIQTANRALKWEYRAGSIMEYFYEKERVLKIAFPDIGPETFISLVLHGLPVELQSVALAMDPVDKKTLIECLQRLPAKQKQLNKHDYSFRESTRETGHKYQEKEKPHYKQYDKKKTHKKEESKGRKQDKVNIVQDIKNEENNEDTAITAAVIANNDGLDVIQMKCNGIMLNVMLDSGACIDLISDKVVKSNGWKTSPEKKLVVSFNNSPFVIDSALDVTLEGSFDSTPLPRTKVHAYVVSGLTFDILLSNPTLKKLNIGLCVRQSKDFSHVYSVQRPSNKVIASLDDVKKMFPLLLRTSFKPKHSVDFKLKENAKLIQSKPYRLSREKFSWVRDKIEQLKISNYIVESRSNWASPIVVVPKDNGKDFRLCVDYRSLNNETSLDPFPFPVIDDVITNLGGCNFFSKIDLKDGFHQLGLTEETRYYTAFCTPFGLYEWTRLPFGWKNSPPVFQRFMMNEILSDLLHDRRITVYIDDIIIGSKDKEECKYMTFLVLQRLHKHGLTINDKKCEFIVPQVTFLGRVIDGQTRTTRQESIDKVKGMAKPVDLHTLRVFLGLCGHFQHFIPKYSALIRPLNNLKKKDVGCTSVSALLRIIMKTH